MRAGHDKIVCDGTLFDGSKAEIMRSSAKKVHARVAHCRDLPGARGSSDGEENKPKPSTFSLRTLMAALTAS